MEVSGGQSEYLSVSLWRFVVVDAIYLKPLGLMPICILRSSLVTLVDWTSI